MGEQNPSFEDVFGIPEPTHDQVERAADALEFKHNNGGDPTGLLALMGVEPIQRAAVEMIDGTTALYVSKGNIDPELAHELVIAGFMNAAELIATILMYARE